MADRRSTGLPATGSHESNRRQARSNALALLAVILGQATFASPVIAASNALGAGMSIGLRERQSATQIIPAKSAVVGKVLLDIVLDPGRKHDLPVTLISAIPIYDADGKIAIPTGSIITALIQKRDGGDYITVDRIVYRGLNITIPCEGRLIPAQIKPENYGDYIEQPPSRVSKALSISQDSILIPTLLGLALGNSNKTDESGSKTDQQNITPLILGIVGLDFGARLLAAIFDNPPKILPPLVEIPEDSLVVFTINESVELPSSNAPDTPYED